ncbi:MAG: hypothetical protein D6675_11885 [Gemmatimonadetes bacterium]|nr:MAG: hypothetical protein D6675_11885 [Gemmatimonadota bacterium]
MLNRCAIFDNDNRLRKTDICLRIGKMRFRLCFWLILILPLTGQSQVVINEIMYHTEHSSQEWVELYNAAEDTINLQNWSIADANFSPKRIISTAFFVPPGSYLTLVRDQAAFETQFPQSDSLWVLEPEDALPALNNSGDVIVLYDAELTPVDSVEFSASWGGDRGISLERIAPQNPSIDPQNWGSCLDPNGGTPTRKNSISIQSIDLAVFDENIRFEPAIPRESTSYVTIYALVYNVGLMDASGFRVIVRDSTQQTLLHEFVQETPLAPGDFIEVMTVYADFRRGDQVIEVIIDFDTDQNPQNNRAQQLLHVSPDAGAVVINEIMYAPHPDEPEWVELFNRTLQPVNLRYWYIADAQREVVLTDVSRVIPAQGYVVLVDDLPTFSAVYPQLDTAFVWQPPEGLPTLNNSGDRLVLSDRRVVRMDSVQFTANWGGQDGISLERINPDAAATDSTNWGDCLYPEGATPLAPNSILAKPVDLAVLTLTIDPDEPQAGDDLTLTATLQNLGRTEVLNFGVRFEELTTGEVIADITVTTPVPPNGAIQDISTTYPNAPAGDYQFQARIDLGSDENPANDAATATVRVGNPPIDLKLNEIYYEDDPEWIELYNAGEAAINLSHWMLADADSTLYAIPEDVPLVEAMGFLIVTENRDQFLTRFPAASCPIIQMERFPTLNKTEDEVRLLDPYLMEVDRAVYRVDDPAHSGNSLERRSPTADPSNPANWVTSVALDGATPCAENSVFTEVIPEKAVLSVSPNPFSPDGDGQDDVTFLTLSLPVNLVDLTIDIYDVQGRLVRQLVNEKRVQANKYPQQWDGRDDQGDPLSIGIYIIFFEAINWQEGIHLKGKATVVLAKNL